MDSLVTTDWLAAELGNGDLVVVDATKHLASAGRDEHAEYIEGHIPGARFLDLGTLVDETSPIPSALPRPDQFAERLANLGNTPEKRVVFYDDSAVKTSARAWFLARAHGLENVAILDGGIAKWRSEGRPLECGMPDAGVVHRFDLPSPSRIRFKADMLANIDSASEQVLDARDGGRFTGATEDTVHDLPSGHIPGSRNLHFVQLFAEDGTFKSQGELRMLFEQAGIALNRPVTTTCGSGVTASVLLFALHLLGHDDTALYDGSWSDWGSDPKMPKATGEAQ